MHAAGSSAPGFPLLVFCLAKLRCFGSTGLQAAKQPRRETEIKPATIMVFFYHNTNSGYILLACVAQMVEHSHGKGKVSGSSPVVGSVKRKMIKYG